MGPVKVISNMFCYKISTRGIISFPKAANFSTTIILLWVPRALISNKGKLRFLQKSKIFRIIPVRVLLSKRRLYNRYQQDDVPEHCRVIVERQGKLLNGGLGQALQVGQEVLKKGTVSRDFLHFSPFSLAKLTHLCPLIDKLVFSNKVGSISQRYCICKTVKVRNFTPPQRIKRNPGMH